MSKKRWEPKEEAWLRENFDKATMADIYTRFHYRSRMSVDLKMHRMRLPVSKSVNKERVARNLITELLSNRIGNPHFFTPKREFYERTGIGQKRFGQLYRGEVNPTKAEYTALIREWNVTIEEAFELRQMELNFEEE